MRFLATTRNSFSIRRFSIGIVALAIVGSTTILCQPTDAAEREVDFRREIQPILAKHCVSCHGPDEAESGLSFSDKAGAFAETESGSFAIVPGEPEESGLIERISSEDEFERMPPEGEPLSKEEIELIRRWVEEGADWSDHWAFEPRTNPDVPQVEDAAWSKNPIDAFIYDSLTQQGLKPNELAGKRVLLRRLNYVLTGLPPDKETLDRFVANEASDAWKQAVDRLLASEHYGEHWGRHWLDLVRFAETNSFERDGPKPNAWKYRDYVIRSFNDDKPYDRFIKEQLAGDELDNVTTDSLTATGYYRLGIWDDEPADPLQARYDALDDIILTTGQVFLGLTMNCARCHDHKIDPIPQADYYSLLSFFEDVSPFARRGDLNYYSQIDVTPDDLKRRYEENDQRRREIEKEILAIEQAGIAKMSAPDQRATEGRKKDRNRVLSEKLKGHLDEAQWERYSELKQDRAKNERDLKALPPRVQVMGLGRYRKVDKPTFVLFRGNPHSPSDEVQPAFPTLFDVDPPKIADSQSDEEQSSGRRKVLADWMTSPENRLTARVIVNRIWQFHFGRGIVRSSNNFGQLGTPPTHPELLDFLATRLIEEDWSLKAIHRLILNSRTFQMASTANAKGMSADPDNDYFWRFDPRRLSAEEVRDTMLFANGSLNLKVYGPSVYPKLSAEVMAGQSRPGSGWGNSSEADQNRRSVYIYVKRSLLTPLLSAFDFPDPDQTCEARFMTLQPAQALSLLNGEFAGEQAQRLAKRVGLQRDDKAFVDGVVVAALGRSATDVEIAEGVDLMTTLQQRHELTRQKAMELYALSVLNWNEFLFVD